MSYLAVTRLNHLYVLLLMGNMYSLPIFDDYSQKYMIMFYHAGSNSQHISQIS